MVLPVIAIVWLGCLYVHALARHLAAAKSAARSRSWAHAFDGCRNEGAGEGAGKGCLDGVALQLDRSGQPVVDEAIEGVLGQWTSRAAATVLARPVWLGGKRLRVTARACLPCNPVPRESVEVVQRVYEESRTGVE